MPASQLHFVANRNAGLNWLVAASKLHNHRLRVALLSRSTLHLLRCVSAKIRNRSTRSPRPKVKIPVAKDV